MALLMFETVLNFSCFFGTTQHSEYYACSQSKEYIIFFQSFSEINTEGGECTLLSCKSLTRKRWKFEAVTNMATVSRHFWGVQSWSFLEVYRRVGVTCCWAEDIDIFFKTVGKCLKNYTSRSTVLYSTFRLLLATDFDYWSYILHPPNTGEKMGIQWTSSSALYRLQESLRFS